jgi:putative ATP-binding cassette transporter
VSAPDCRAAHTLGDSTVTGLGSTLATIWRLGAPYFRSEDRRAGCVLLATIILIELSIVAINVMINQWNNRFYNALQDKNWDVFVSELLFFCLLAAIFIVLAVYQLYLNQWLQIRWRRWMTEQYLGEWLINANHYRMQLLGDAADNPDQRIAEDINQFIEKGLFLGLGLLNSLVTLASFIAILWVLSASAPFTLFGNEWAIPGYLVWAALIYSILGTIVTQWIGHALVGLNFMQQRYEADFRYNLVRVRENAEQIALLEGEPAERQRLLERFGRVIGNWMLIMSRTKRLTFFTAGFSQISTIFPYAVVSPAYFAGTIQLGGLMQTASAFAQVQGALSFFVSSTIYRQLAEWRAVIERLAGFQRAVEAGRLAAVDPPVVEVKPVSGGRTIELDKVEVKLPAGKPLVAAEQLALAQGDRVLLTGPSGSGKSTLFRAIAGIWPFGSGSVTVPEDARLMMLPQRPYFPVGTLTAAVAYPAETGAFSREQIAATLEAVGLPALTQRLDEEAHWNRMLSLGEQQRLGIARAILQKPDFLFLDEATASLDEPSEEKLYRLLQERLPDAAIISIGHRSTLEAFHRRRLKLEPQDGRHKVQEAAVAVPAE